MDKCSSDAEFDSYWEFEAKNKNRNRIRVGRQYQATVPPLLKPGEKDARKCEDLETLKWKPNQISEQDIDSFLSMAKTIENNRAPEKPPENSLQTAIKGLTEFVTSHHPCHHDAGCKVPVSAPSSSSPSEASSSKSSAICNWTPPEARLFVQALEKCGKNFCAIKKEFLPWKPVRSLIEYYYYFNGKEEKPDSPIPKATSPVDEPSFDDSVCKVEKTEPVASCSQETQETEVVGNSDTKEEKVFPEVTKTEPELPTTPSKEEKPPESKEEALPQSIEQETNLIQSTVGSLKFFLGGRLVLKLNAQADTCSGNKCQWVQSHDTPRYGHQSKKMRHRKKSIQDMVPQVSATSPKPKKKHEEDVNSHPECAVKKLKLKTPPPEPFPLLCSSSWTPPIADGQDAVELDDASSKTSESHDSPVVLANRGIKTDVHSDAKRLEASSDVHESKKLVWSTTEPIPGPSSDIYEEYSSRGSSFTSEKISPDISYGHEVLNHKSALTPSKVRVKSSSSLPRTAHSSSPNMKLFNKNWSNSNMDLEKPKCLPCFHSPHSFSCHASPENTSRDYVLDLSSKPGFCKIPDSKLSQEPCCCPNECTENCSSSEESAYNDTSLCCMKSSNLIAYHRDTPVPGSETSKSEVKSLARTLDCEENQVSKTAGDELNECSETADGVNESSKTVDGPNESSEQCLCCCNPSTSCASPKSCKSYASKEHVCNKEDCSHGDSPTSIISSAADVYSKKQQPWFGTPVPPLLQCYPYYIAYDINPSVQTTNTSATEAPLDLSNNEGPATKNKSLPNSVPEIGVDIPQNAAGTKPMSFGK